MGRLNDTRSGCIRDLGSMSSFFFKQANTSIWCLQVLNHCKTSTSIMAYLITLSNVFLLYFSFEILSCHQPRSFQNLPTTLFKNIYRGRKISRRNKFHYFHCVFPPDPHVLYRLPPSPTIISRHVVPSVRWSCIPSCWVISVSVTQRATMEFSIDALKFIVALADKNNFLSVLQT